MQSIPQPRIDYKLMNTSKRYLDDYSDINTGSNAIRGYKKENKIMQAIGFIVTIIGIYFILVFLTV